MNLENQFSEYNSEVSKELPSYSGLLGLSIGGSRTVNIATRAGFVYVRLRDNLNEVVQAYNDKVSPVYDLPVLIQRVGNRWHVIGKDTARYDVWGTSAPFLPAHAGQHEFNRANGSGGDTVFVYDDQFMPLLVYPSGTSGAGMLMVAPYVLQRSSDFVYVGNTGTGNLLIYKPTNNQAIMGLVVLNKTTGNPEVLIASGTPFSGGITGTHQVLPYLAYPASHQEPLYGFRLVSGTTALRWENLYNVRQFIGGSQSTGTSSGSIPTFVTGSIPFSASNGVLTEDNANLYWNDTNDQLFIGKHGAEQFDQDDVYPLVITSKTPNNAVGYSVFTYGTGTLGGPSPTYVAWRSRGTYTTPDTVKKDDSLITISTLAYDGSGWNNNARVRFYADQNWITGSVRPTRMDFEVTPSGSATRRTQFQIYGDSTNIPTGSTYNIGGIPHTHEYDDLTGKPAAETNSDFIFRPQNSPGSSSAFVGTIATLPGGATLTYNVTSGNEGAMVPIVTTNLAKMRLYNTTRGTYALISNCVTGTNTITLTANVPSGWVVGDTITIASQTVSGGGYNWFDLEITSGPTGKSALFFEMLTFSGTVGDYFTIHPFESYSIAKEQSIVQLVASQAVTRMAFIKITSNLFSMAWSGNSTVRALRELGYM